MQWYSFMENGQVVNALWIGAFVAAISAMLGVFVVMRGQSFAGHVLTDVGASGGAGAFLFGVNAWYGFMSFGLLAALGIDLTGDRARNRDVATGIILTFAMGLSALFLYLDSQFTASANSTMMILFGSIFAIPPIMMPIMIGTTVVEAVLLFLIFRPLLFSSIQPEMAMTRGVPVRLISLLYMLMLAVAVENGSIIVGALLSTGLLIGPAATAVQLTERPVVAMFMAMGIGVVATWAGILLAYFSYNWPPVGRGYPVSFFISVIILVIYLLVRVSSFRKGVIANESGIR